MSISKAGDTITIAGSGIFNVGDRSITGEGWYKHSSANGKLHDKGIWKAQKLSQFC
jgi:hypothetical protein